MLLGTSLILNFSYNKHKPLQKMLQYCLKCKKDMENGDSKVFKTKNGGAMLSSKLVV